LAELGGTRSRLIWDLEHGKSPSIVVASKLVNNPGRIEPPFRPERATVPDFQSHPSG